MSRRTTILVFLSLVLTAAPALAAKGGNHNASATAGCGFAGNVVQAAGLPTDQVINFMVTDSSGTSGWVLGFTPDGTWSVNVAAPSESTTYEFVSRTFGPNGSKYAVFTSCSS